MTPQIAKALAFEVLLGLFEHFDCVPDGRDEIEPVQICLAFRPAIPDCDGLLQRCHLVEDVLQTVAQVIPG